MEKTGRTAAPSSHAGQELLTPEELVARWRGRVKLGTLADWRTGRNKTGPGFVRLYAGGPVLYPIAEVLAYEARNTFLTSRAPVRGKSSEQEA